jgi:hypothetical protein
MKKLIMAACAFVGLATQNYAQMTPEEMATFLRTDCDFRSQIESIYSDPKVNKLSVDNKLELLGYTWRLIVMADLAQVINLEGIIPMPYFQWSCPQVPPELIRGSVQIGNLNQDDIYDLIQTSIELEDLSNGLMRNTETSPLPIYVLSQDLREFRQYLKFRNMGPLAEIYLQAKAHPEKIILPDMPSDVQTLAYPTDTAIRDADGRPNPEFFEKWWKNIQARFAS